mmetsp:Transcript_22639/g.57350  ORF Transcript_22639/g.57350 Transcript_22639/m.57350 type:complete len:621 (+) Transcript_22639:585-2447(+)|eukprot:CAMPEP_0178988400 /NCGR_PEP_ID=MMETSP0795-20121207/3790_1 /TAXON_ID=88552 /ORGANISM="Amoebophrya sp., Strain Ameob2" /LENGTH=620 /DNA_ID=CAMNT_0020679671 /DNA_START=513 /DNA_END=2375 /DNA_ORIENTATION=+
MVEDTKIASETPAVEQEQPPRKKQVVFVLGGPGAGKGTQCLNVVRRMRGWATISAGDVLRACRKDHPESEEAKTIEKHITAGTIVPVEITIKLIHDKMNEWTTKQRGRRNKFLIDGFPRNKDNVSGFEKKCGEECDVRKVLFFDVPDDEMVKRVLARAEKDAEKGEKRSDDTEEGIKKRLATNKKECEPIVKMFEENGKLLKVDGSKSVKEVWSTVQSTIRDIEKQIRIDYPGPPRAEGGKGGGNKGKGKGSGAWIKVGEIDPNSKRCNFFGKVCAEPVAHERVKDLFEVQVGDDTATVTCSLHKEKIEAAGVKMGETLRFHNAVVRMRQNYIRVEIDKYGKLQAASSPPDVEETTDEGATPAVPVPESPEITKINTEKNVSATEYEAVDPKTLKGKEGKGKGKRGRRGRGGANKEVKSGSPKSGETTDAPKSGESADAKPRRKRGGRNKAGAEKAAELTKVENAADDALPEKKKRTRKGKGKRKGSAGSNGGEQVSNKDVDLPPANAEKKKGRSRKGRGKKNKEEGTADAEPVSAATVDSTDAPAKKKGRGRKRKGSAQSGGSTEEKPKSGETKSADSSKPKGKGKGKGGKGKKGKGKGGNSKGGGKGKAGGAWVKKDE